MPSLAGQFCPMEKRPMTRSDAILAILEMNLKKKLLSRSHFRLPPPKGRGRGLGGAKKEIKKVNIN